MPSLCISHRGESSRSFATLRLIKSTAKSISASVVKRPRVKRIELCASSSLVTEWVKGMSVEQAMTIVNSQIAEELSLPPVKIHCSVLAEDAIKAAIRDWQRKRAEREAQARGDAAQ